MRTFLVRVLLKVAWSVGGHPDDVDGLPRLTLRDLDPLHAALLPGDFVLLGNNGRLTHVALHVGAGVIVHAMATEKTMRGWTGSVWDAVKRALGAPDRFVGVVEEPLDAFLARYERDTWVLVRHPSLSESERAAGLAHVRGLIGRPYDYGFSSANDDLYCTEIVDEFLRAALGPRAPRLETSRVKVPLLLDQEVIQPDALLKHAELQVVAGNAAARHHYGDRLPLV